MSARAMVTVPVARLSSLTAVSTNGVVVEAYGYDPMGRRAYTATATSSGTATNWHAYVGMHCVADLDAAGTVLRSYTYGPGIDNLLAMTVHGATETNTYFALTDHLGTVHALVSSVGSVLSVVESYRYDAWGNVLAVYDASGTPISNPQSAINNRFLFQCREYSWATRLCNFRARWYDPATGRWLSNDPIGISGGLNQYVFCGNDPVDYVDPEGLESWWKRRKRRRMEKKARDIVTSSFFNAADKVHKLNELKKKYDDLEGACDYVNSMVTQIETPSIEGALSLMVETLGHSPLHTPAVGTMKEHEAFKDLDKEVDRQKNQKRRKDSDTELPVLRPLD